MGPPCHINDEFAKPFSLFLAQLVQVAEVRLERGVARSGRASGSTGHGRRAHGRTGGRGRRRRRTRAVGSRGERLLREHGVRVVHEVLQELLVLATEVLTGLLETVNLVQLVLLLGERLANDLASLLVGLVADALRVVATASASCGTTPIRPPSSWETPAPWRLAVCSQPCP